MQKDIFDELKRSLQSNEAVVLATVVDGSCLGRQILVRSGDLARGSLGSSTLDRQVGRFAEALLPSGQSCRETFVETDETIAVFFDVLPPPPELVVVGAVHVAMTLVEYARALGYYTVVIDPRSVFATRERFPNADCILQQWPQQAFVERPLHAASSIAVLSHDLKIDVPALAAALESPALYIGALGSRRTHAKRVQALQELGFEDQAIARVRSPIGLDLGGRRPEEIALSIAAEMIAARHDRESHFGRREERR